MPKPNPQPASTSAKTTATPAAQTPADVLAAAQKALVEAERAVIEEAIKAARPMVDHLAKLGAEEAIRAAGAALRFAEDLGQKAGLTHEQIRAIADTGREQGKAAFIPKPPPPSGLSYKRGTPLNPHPISPAVVTTTPKQEG